MKGLTVAIVFLIACLCAFSRAARAADNGTEFFLEDDFTARGLDGSATDPDVEVKGFTVFGATQTAPALNIPAAPGNIFVNGYVQISSGLYVNASSTFTGSMYVAGVSTFTDNLYISGFSSAANYYGNGSGLTNVLSTSSVQRTGDTMTGSLTLLGVSTLTVNGNAFSVGGSALVVSSGKVGFGTSPSFPVDIYSASGNIMRIKSSENYGLIYLMQDAVSRGAMGYVGGLGTLFINGELADAVGVTGDAGVQLGSNGNMIMTLANKRAGVGTKNPIYALDISTVDSNTDSYLFRAGGDGIVISTGGAIQTTGQGHGIIIGNSRGMGAVDLQTYRTNATQVASGNYSAIGGGAQNTTGGDYSFAAGNKSASTIAGAFTWTDSEGMQLSNNVQDRTVFKNRGGFMITGSTNTTMSGTNDRGILFTGNGLIGISTDTPRAALDIVSTGTTINQYAQIWRDSDGAVVASMTATGRLYTAATVDSLGNHVATTTLNMADKPIIGVSSLTIIAPDSYASSLWVSTSVTTPHLYVSAAGNVGIGTASPSSSLSIQYGDMNGPAFAISNTANSVAMGLWSGISSQFFIQRGSGNKFLLDNSGLVGMGGVYSPGAALDVKTLDTGGPAIALRVSKGTDITHNPLFIVEKSGNVGIGLPNPGEKLSVSGNISATGGLTLGDNSAPATLSIGAGAGESVIVAPGNQGLTIMATADEISNRSFQVQTYKADKSTFLQRFVITGAADTSKVYALNANVGIGTDDPKEALDVIGGVKISTAANTLAGTVQYFGGHFQGYNGASWTNFDVSGGGWINGGGTIYPGDLSDSVGIGIVPSGNKLQVYDNTSAAGQHGILSRTYPTTGILTTGYGIAHSKSAIVGLADSNGTVNKVFGVAGYLSDTNQKDSAGVFGGADKGTAGSPSAWGALGYRDAAAREWAGYFNGSLYASSTATANGEDTIYAYQGTSVGGSSLGLTGARTAIVGHANAPAGAFSNIIGVAGYLNSSSVKQSAGVFGAVDANASGPWGALGYLDGSGFSWAGYFNGDVNLERNVSNTRLSISAAGPAATYSPSINTKMKNDSGAIPLNSILFTLDSAGYNSNSSMYQSAAKISVVADAPTGDIAADMPGRIEFATTPDGTDVSQTRMVIRNDGRVGIGITNPTESLSVLGGATFTGVITASTFNAVGTAFMMNGVTVIDESRNIYVNNINSDRPISISSISLTGSLTVGDDSTMTVTGNAFSVGLSTFVVQSGKVGVGTMDPIAKFHVAGNNSPSPLPIILQADNNTSAGSGGYINLIAGTANNAASMGGHVSIMAGANGATTGQGGDVYIQAGAGGGSSGGEGGNIIFMPGNGYSAGRVGIGTTAPRTVLDVKGFIATSGQSRVTTTFSVTGSITPVAIPGLSVNLVDGKTYAFDIILYTASNTAGGIRVALTGGGATASSVVGDAIWMDSGAPSKTRFTTLGGPMCAVTGGTLANCHIMGTMTVGEGGTFAPAFAQNAVNAAPSTVEIGSTMIVQEIN